MQTYLAKIIASVGSPLFQHLYMATPSSSSSAPTPVSAEPALPVASITSRDATQNGSLSCALHVSSLLVLSGFLQKPHATVRATIKALGDAGWHKTAAPTPGAIAVWPPDAAGHSHIGFFVADNEAISNSTKLRVPVRHSLTLSDGRVPAYFLTHKTIAQTPVVPIDTRNVVDRYRHQSVSNIVHDLDVSRSDLEIAIENLERDFNMGTIVRTANAFNVKKVHIIGSRQWNKRGAMKTDAYLHIVYHQTVDDFINEIKTQHKALVAVDIVPEAMPLHETALPKQCVLVFGSEGPGLSAELRQRADKTVAIEQFGSTRSINVGVAAGIAMYAWVQQHRFSCTEAPSVQE